MSNNTEHLDNPLVDAASQEIDDILDRIVTDSNIPNSVVREFLEDIAYRCEVSAKSVGE